MVQDVELICRQFSLFLHVPDRAEMIESLEATAMKIVNFTSPESKEVAQKDFDSWFKSFVQMTNMIDALCARLSVMLDNPLEIREGEGTIRLSHLAERAKGLLEANRVACLEWLAKINPLQQFIDAGCLDLQRQAELSALQQRQLIYFKWYLLNDVASIRLSVDEVLRLTGDQEKLLEMVSTPALLLQVNKAASDVLVLRDDQAQKLCTAFVRECLSTGELTWDLFQRGTPNHIRLMYKQKSQFLQGINKTIKDVFALTDYHAEALGCAQIIEFFKAGELTWDDLIKLTPTQAQLLNIGGIPDFLHGLNKIARDVLTLTDEQASASA